MTYYFLDEEKTHYVLRTACERLLFDGDDANTNCVDIFYDAFARNQEKIANQALNLIVINFYKPDIALRVFEHRNVYSEAHMKILQALSRRLKIYKGHIPPSYSDLLTTPTYKALS